MSVTGTKGLGLPTVLLHESKGHTVTVETKSTETYRGFLHETEDNMNVHMKNVTHTDRDGKVSKLEAVYLRGNQIRFFIPPDMLEISPMFERVRKYKRSKGRYIPQGSGVQRAGRGGGAPGGRR